MGRGGRMGVFMDLNKESQHRVELFRKRRRGGLRSDMPQAKPLILSGLTSKALISGWAYLSIAVFF